mgnify:CR=1 FL=1
MERGPQLPQREVLGDDEPFRAFLAARMGALLSFVVVAIPLIVWTFAQLFAERLLALL